MTHLITFADNNAVGYFQKQGFTKEILMEREKWSGYIKEYDGGTLMECIISGAVLPADFPRVIKLQREAVEVRPRTCQPRCPRPACLRGHSHSRAGAPHPPRRQKSGR